MTKLKVQMKRKQFQISKFNNRSLRVQEFELCLPAVGRHRQGFSILKFKHLFGFSTLTFGIILQKDLSSQTFFELLSQHGNNLKEVTDNPVGSNFKNRGFNILIDGDDDIRCFHPSLVLDGT